MSAVEKYKELKAKFTELVSKLNSLPAEIDRVRSELVPMQDAAVRAEITGDKHAANRRAEIDQAKRKQADLEAERKDLAHRREIMKQVLDEYRVTANQEMIADWNPRFKAAKLAFAKAVEEAHAAEVAMRKVFQDARVASDEIDTPNPVPTWSPEFIPDLGRDDLAPKWRDFLDRLVK